MAAMLRLLQHGDGGLALFNGSNEGEDLQIGLVLQRAASGKGPLQSAPASGFQRLQAGRTLVLVDRSEEHTSELQSLMRISYAVFCLKKKKKKNHKLQHY